MHFPILTLVMPGNVVSQVELTLAVVLFDFMETFVDWKEVNFVEFDDIDVSYM